MRSTHHVLLAVVVAAGLALPASAQTAANITSSDIQRLQDNVYLAERDVSELRSRDATRAAQLQSQLDDLRDEVIYLKVKLRKEGSLPRAEYTDVRDRIDGLRASAREEPAAASARPAPAPAPQPASAASAPARTSAAQPAAPAAQSSPAPAGAIEIPAGTEIEARLQNALNSGTAQVEDRFEATTLADLTIGGRTAIPAGSVMRGVVTAVEPATRTNRTARMTVSFDQVTVNGRAYPIRATVTQAIEGEGIRGEVGRAGAGAAVGGLLGAVLGGAKGAILGAVIGGGGTIAATEGKEVELPQGTVLRVRIDSPVQIAAPARQ